MITIREATDADGPKIVALIQGVWDEYEGKGRVLDVFTELEAAPRASHGMFWVATNSFGRIVGTIAATVRSKTRVELQKMYVHPAYRQNGLGARLVALVEAWAVRQGALLIEAYTDTQLTAAHRLYNRHGYVFGGTVAMADVTRYRIEKELRPLSMWTRHPASAGETYLQHQRTAGHFGRRMFAGAMALFVHSLLPFLFVNTGSRIISELSSRMINRQLDR